MKYFKDIKPTSGRPAQRVYDALVTRTGLEAGQIARVPHLQGAVERGRGQLVRVPRAELAVEYGLDVSLRHFVTCK